MLVYCSECGHEVSDKAECCQNCGYAGNKNSQPVVEERGFVAKLFSTRIRCPNCGHVGDATRTGWDVSGCLISVILLCFLIVPGLIYMVYRDGVAATTCCPKCGNTNVVKI